MEGSGSSWSSQWEQFIYRVRTEPRLKDNFPLEDGRDPANTRPGCSQISRRSQEDMVQRDSHLL